MRVLPIVLVVASACGRSSPPVTPVSPLPESLGSQEVIMLYRSPCYAGCPVYSVRVTRGGLVTYEGRQRVFRLGILTARISPRRVDALLEELNAAGFSDLADRYRPSEPACGSYVPDAPTVITEVKLGDRLKRIEHDHGCGGAPAALRILESRIDEAVGTGRWTGR